MHKDVDEKSLAELAPSYEVASAYLVHMLEARFASLNSFMQHMFLKFHDIEDPEKKAFILETLRREFSDVVIEARKVFRHFNKLGSHVEVVGTTNEDFRVPIPCKLVGIHDALEKKFNWICSENVFDESSVPMRDYKGYLKTHLDTIQFIIEKTSTVDLNTSFENT
jgi:5'(3')-deoxyribonucleotidase